MSHAANLGLLDMVKAIAALGAKLMPGIIMGSCETPNSHGFAFVDEAGGPLTNDKSDKLAPLALVLETYSRNPGGKHEILRRFMNRSYDMPDTPVMAFHFGDLDRLKIHLQHDPQLLHRRFSHREIYVDRL
jgi:hypothetical protein